MFIYFERFCNRNVLVFGKDLFQAIVILVDSRAELVAWSLVLQSIKPSTDATNACQVDRSRNRWLLTLIMIWANFRLVRNVPSKDIIQFAAVSQVDRRYLRLSRRIRVAPIYVVVHLPVLSLNLIVVLFECCNSRFYFLNFLLLRAEVRLLLELLLFLFENPLLIHNFHILNISLRHVFFAAFLSLRLLSKLENFRHLATTLFHTHGCLVLFSVRTLVDFCAFSYFLQLFLNFSQ